MRARLSAAALALGAVLLFPAARLTLVAREELAAGVAASRAGEPRTAQVHFERAARCGFPLNLYADEALRRLADLSEAWRRDHETVHALSAVESVRGIILSTGQAFRHSALLGTATDSVVLMRRELSGVSQAGEPRREAAAESDVRRTLVRKRAPRTVPALVGVLSLWAAGFLLLLAARDWARHRHAGSGLRWYLVACLTIAAAFAVLSAA